MTTQIDGSKHKVFVYGTLLEGLENSFLLQNETKVNIGVTVEEFYMVANLTFRRTSEVSAYEPTAFEPQDKYAFPFLMRKPISEAHMKHRIVGEVYEVSSETLNRLDVLEDHPRSYMREKIKVENLDDGSICDADVYLLKSDKIFQEISLAITTNKDPPCYYCLVKVGSWREYLKTLVDRELHDCCIK